MIVKREWIVVALISPPVCIKVIVFQLGILLSSLKDRLLVHKILSEVLNEQMTIAKQSNIVPILKTNTEYCYICLPISPHSIDIGFTAHFLSLLSIVCKP